MNSATKILQKMRNDPRDWRIDDFEVVAQDYGITVRRSGGSHVIFQAFRLGHRAKRTGAQPIKPVYVHKFLELIDDIESAT